MTCTLSNWLSHLSQAVVISLVVLPSSAYGLDAQREAELIHLVRQDCGSCHGMTLNGGLGRPLLPETLKDADSEAIAAIILGGVPGKPMPPWSGLLSEADAVWIAKKLKEGFPQ
ncbi:hypothetical protein MnTg02_01045 [bacterium MnTg02]|nr:hypothetical protein MnTg02_01045 [bacterium MnTg02]